MRMVAGVFSFAPCKRHVKLAADRDGPNRPSLLAMRDMADECGETKSSGKRFGVFNGLDEI